MREVKTNITPHRIRHPLPGCRVHLPASSGEQKHRLFHDEERILGVMNGSEGTEIYRTMEVDDARDHVVFKNRYSAFHSKPPELQDRLEGLGRRIRRYRGGMGRSILDTSISITRRTSKGGTELRSMPMLRDAGTRSLKL